MTFKVPKIVDAAAMLAQWADRNRGAVTQQAADELIAIARLAATAPTLAGDWNAGIEAVIAATLVHSNLSTVGPEYREACQAIRDDLRALTRPTPTAPEPNFSDWAKDQAAEGRVGICVACALPIIEGDAFYPDHNNGGELHAACCGPERECFTDGEGNPLADNAPIPSPSIWRSDTDTPEPEGGEQPVAWQFQQLDGTWRDIERAQLDRWFKTMAEPVVYRALYARPTPPAVSQKDDTSCPRCGEQAVLMPTGSIVCDDGCGAVSAGEKHDV